MIPSEALQAPIPHDLPLPLPLSREALLAFLVLSFLLHILFVNLVVGGSFLSTALHWIGWRRKSPKHLNLSHAISKTITVNKSLAVVLGVGPLLAMNLAYTLYFYSANALSGIVWMMVVPLVTIAFLLTYVHKYLGDRLLPSIHWVSGALATAIFLFIPLIFLSNINLMLFPEKWPTVQGFLSILLLPSVLARYAHFLLASFAATGLFLVWWTKRNGLEDVGFSRTELLRLFYRIVLTATVSQWLVGPILYFSLPSHGVTSRVTGVILIGVTLSLALIAVLWNELRDAENIGGKFPMAVSLFSIIVLFMGTGRHFYREDATAWHRAEVTAQTESFQKASQQARELLALEEAAGGGADLGKKIYESTCAACHQKQGQGIPSVFPPLAGSEWVLEEDPQRLVSVVFDGLGGEIQVLGVTYKGQMPAHKSRLNDKETAALLSYIRNSWGNSAPEVTPEQTAKERHNERSKPWTQDEIGRPKR